MCTVLYIKVTLCSCLDPTFCYFKFTLSYPYVITTCFCFLFNNRSESPSQAFLIILNWLSIILKRLSPSYWGKIYLAYDNLCVMLMAWKLWKRLRLSQHLLTKCGQPWTRLLTVDISGTTRTLTAKRNIIQSSSRNNCQAWTQWQQNRHLSGWLASKKFYVLCRKLIIFFSCIE